MKKPVAVLLLLLLIPSWIYAEDRKTGIDLISEQWAAMETLIKAYKNWDPLRSTLLVKASTLNTELYNNIKEWRVDTRSAILMNPELAPDQQERAIIEIDGAADTFFNQVCDNHNIIAGYMATEGKIEKASAIYKRILRDFDKRYFKGCFKEAEISLRELINKQRKQPEKRDGI